MRGFIRYLALFFFICVGFYAGCTEKNPPIGTEKNKEEQQNQEAQKNKKEQHSKEESLTKSDANSVEKILEKPPAKPLTDGPCAPKAPFCKQDYHCRSDVNPNLCHLTCDPNAKTHDCPDNALCRVQDTGDGICVKGKEANIQEKCDPSNICKQGLVCVLTQQGSTSGTCYRRCTLKTLNSCPTGEYCFLAHSQNGVCLKGKFGTKKEDEACKRTNECEAGLICFTPYQRSSRCSRLCDSEHPCGLKEACAQIDGAKKNNGACVK